MNIVMLLFFIISNILINFYCIYFCHSLVGKKFELTDKRNIITILFMTVFTLITNYFCPQSIKFILSFIVLVTIIYLIVDKNVQKACLVFILLEISMAVYEMIYSFIINIIIGDDNTILMNILSNSFVSIVGILIIKMKVPQIIYNKTLKSIKAIKNNEIVLYSLMIIIIIIFSTIESYIKMPLSIVIVTNTIITLIFIFVISRFINAKNNYKNISDKYQTSISSLKEYESMIDKYRVNNHENKNELMTVRNMIITNDKTVVEYIDKLVDNKIKDNEKIMYKTSKIPEGGLRATIYSKLTLMDNYKIKYTLDIANDVRTADLINLGEDLTLNICKILGVFLDNAIEAVRKLRKKNIDVEFYIMDGYLNIDITNNFKGMLDINKLGMRKYTTKGDGHGYGLSLVEQIISENSKFLKNEKRINGDKFTQTLKIKM